MILLSIYCLTERIWDFKNQVYRLFFASKCFIPRKEMRNIPSRVQLILLPIYCLSEWILEFKNQYGLSFFCFKMFYSPRGDMWYLTRGPNDTLSICCLSERLEHFKNQKGLSTFFPSKCFIWWDGVGWDGLGCQKYSLIFFILRYIKHYTHINLYI